MGSLEEFQHFPKLSVLVPISPLLKAIIPPNLSSAETYKLSLPVSSNTLKSMMLLLYTGEARASETQMADIKDGLTLLGILQPAPAAQLEKKVPKMECEGSSPSLAVGINSSQVCHHKSSPVYHLPPLRPSSRPLLSLCPGQSPRWNCLPSLRRERAAPTTCLASTRSSRRTPAITTPATTTRRWRL